MADKAIIEQGKRLHRLMESEDFAPFLAELDSRIANCKAQYEGVGMVLDAPAHIASNIAQRLYALTSIREWLDEEIERGGKEILKEQLEKAKEPA